MSNEKPIEGVELFAAVQALVALKSVVSVAPLSLDLLRKCQASIRALAPMIDEALRSADEEELAEAKARVAEIESRLTLKAVEPPRKATPPTTVPDEVEGGAGLGIAAVEGATAQEFQDELRQLRAHTQAKRRRLT